MITLKTLKDATAQQVFDQVAAHLLKQNTKAEKRRTPRGMPDAHPILLCSYRGDNDTMCAAGCLIGDDEHKADWEGLPWSEIASEVKVLNHSDLIAELQGVHDALSGPESWALDLRRVAEAHGLSYSVLEQNHETH